MLRKTANVPFRTLRARRAHLAMRVCCVSLGAIGSSLFACSTLALCLSVYRTTPWLEYCEEVFHLRRAVVFQCATQLLYFGLVPFIIYRAISLRIASRTSGEGKPHGDSKLCVSLNTNDIQSPRRTATYFKPYMEWSSRRTIMCERAIGLLVVIFFVHSVFSIHVWATRHTPETFHETLVACNNNNSSSTPCPSCYDAYLTGIEPPFTLVRVQYAWHALQWAVVVILLSACVLGSLLKYIETLYKKRRRLAQRNVSLYREHNAGAGNTAYGLETDVENVPSQPPAWRFGYYAHSVSSRRTAPVIGNPRVHFLRTTNDDQ